MKISALVFAGCMLVPSLGSTQEALSRAVQQGSDKGFKTCARPLDKIVRFVHSDDTKYAHLGTWNRGKPDAKTFNTVTIQPYADGTTFASMTGIPNRAGECDVVLTQVLPVPATSCSALREKAFKDWKFLQDLGGVPLFELPGDESTTVFLSPLGTTGCLIIKSAVVYGEVGQ